MLFPPTNTSLETLHVVGVKAQAEQGLNERRQNEHRVGKETSLLVICTGKRVVGRELRIQQGRDNSREDTEDTEVTVWWQLQGTLVEKGEHCDKGPKCEVNSSTGLLSDQSDLAERETLVKHEKTGNLKGNWE